MNITSKNKKLILISLVLLFIGNIIVTIGNGSFGTKLGNIEEKITSLQEENKKLEAKILVSDSLTQISKEAQSTGFTTPHQLLYITSESSVAQVPVN